MAEDEETPTPDEQAPEETPAEEAQAPQEEPAAEAGDWVLAGEP